MAIRNAVQERAKEQSADTNSAKNLEIKMNEEYNGNKSYSLQDSADANLATIKRLILAIRGRRGLKYDGGRVIRIPDNDMATLRHKFMTEHHYSNRSGGNIDCIDCFGQGGKKHYFYVFHVGEDNRVAPIFRLDYEYIERYLDDVQKISKEMGYNKDEFVNTASGNGKGIDRIRNLAKGDSVYDVSATGRETNHRSGEVYNSEGGRGSTDNGYSSSGISNGYDKQGNNGNLNVGKKYSLKWHTDLTQTQLKQVENWLRQEGNPEETRITDTANWYKGRINGDDLFVIYSNEDANPTILYEVKGKNAKVELNILMELLEEVKNGKSNDGKSAYVSWVSGGGWMRQGNGIRNNISRLGSGQNNQNAGVLQGQPQGKPSPAFENVIRNLFKEPEVKSYSLKGSSGNILSEEQSASNTNTTSNPDILFSLKKPVEETKDLVAVHNMQVSEVERTLDLGGLPMPSIAVIETQSGNNRTSKKVSLRLPSLQRQTQRSL